MSKCNPPSLGEHGSARVVSRDRHRSLLLRRGRTFERAVRRLRDRANNYYVVRANALEDNVVLYKTVDGTRSSLDLVGQKGGYGAANRCSRWRTRPSRTAA
jgi:hypothetical protein